MPRYLHWNQAPPKGQQVPEQDIPCKFSSNTGTQPWVPIYRLPKVTPKPLTSQNSLLDTSLHSREKKSSSTHQNTDTSLPNQDTLTSQLYNPTTARKLHNKENSPNCRNTERPGKKWIKRSEDNLRDLQDNIKHPNIQIIGVPEEEDKKKDHEKILEQIIVENFPKMGKEIITQVQETQRVPNRINPRWNTPRNILIKLTKIKHKEQILKVAR